MTLKYFFVLAILILPCSATISVSIDMSMPNGQPGIALGHEFEGCNAQIDTFLDPVNGWMSESGTCKDGLCGSWISYKMQWTDGYMAFQQGFVAHDRAISWGHTAIPRGIETWINSY